MPESIGSTPRVPEELPERLNLANQLFREYHTVCGIREKAGLPNSGARAIPLGPAALSRSILALSDPSPLQAGIRDLLTDILRRPPALQFPPKARYLAGSS